MTLSRSRKVAALCSWCAGACRPVETQKNLSWDNAHVWQWPLSKKVVMTVCPLHCDTISLSNVTVTSCAARSPPQYAPAPPWLLTLKSVWELHVTWGTPVQSFIFLGLLVFELEPMYATSDRRTTDADDRLMPPPPLRGRGHNKFSVRQKFRTPTFNATPLHLLNSWIHQDQTVLSIRQAAAGRGLNLTAVMLKVISEAGHQRCS